MNNNLIIVCLLSFLLIINIVLFCLFKKKAFIIYSIFLTVLLITAVFLTVCNVQPVPNVFYAELILILLGESVLLLIAFKNMKILIIIAAAALIAGGLSFFLHRSQITKEINDTACIGVYDSFTGTSETYVYYYKACNKFFMSTECYCIENYGIVFESELDFDVDSPVWISFPSDRQVKYENRNCGEKSELVIDESLSTMGDPYCDDENVYYPCDLTIVNNTDETLSFALSADFSEEYRSGIITDAKIKGCFAETDSEDGAETASESYIATILPHSSCEYRVIFTAARNSKYNGTALKMNRNLPDIKAEIQN